MTEVTPRSACVPYTAVVTDEQLDTAGLVRAASHDVLDLGL